MKEKEEGYEALEEYRVAGLVSAGDRTLKENTTDEKWQKEWEIRKKFLVPYKNPPKRYGVASKDLDTNYQLYCSFINDSLKELRSGRTAYCFFIYQIEDLYKFFPDIQVKYHQDARCFIVNRRIDKEN